MILWTITNIKILGTRSEKILDNYIEMNKIILLKNVDQILKRYRITLIVKLSHNKIDDLSYTMIMV